METLTPLARRWLMTALSTVLLPHLLVLPWWFAVFTVIALGLGWGRSFVGFPRLHRFLKYLLFLIALLGFFVTFGFPAGRSSGSALLVLMAALKPLEIEQPKNARHLLLLSYFLVAAYFFSYQEIAAALWMFTAEDIEYSDKDGKIRKENDLGIEFDAYLKYKLYDNLEFAVNAGYLFSGDAMDFWEVDDCDGSGEEDIFISTMRVRYKF